MKNAAAENFNMIPGWTKTLDFAAKHKMTVMLEEGRQTPHIANNPEKLKELEQVIEKVKNHLDLDATTCLMNLR